MNKLIKILALVLLVTACGQNENNPERELSELKIVTNNGNEVFMVETAQTEEEKRRGLMFRKTLDERKGMIFNMNTTRSTAMWMKNTFIPLDIIFIGEDNRIAKIYENARPHSEKLMVSSAPTRAVLELKAGMVKKFGIRIDDKIEHHILTQ